MKNIIDKINNFIKSHTNLVVFLLAFPHIYHITFPNGSIPIIEFSISRLRLLSCLLIFLLFLINKKKTSKLLIASFAYSFVILISTFINYRDNLNHSILFVSSFLGLSLLIEYFKDNLIQIISPILLCFELQIYPNLITVALFRNTLSEYSYNINKFLLGTANDMILYLLPALFLSILYIKLTKHKLGPIITIIIVSLTILLSDSFTTMVSLLMFIIVFIYCAVIKKNNIKYTYLIFLIPLIIYAIVVLPYLISGSNAIMQYVFDNIYYNHSFECRAFIWTDAKKYILDRPILGYGYYNDSIVMIGNENDIYSLAHNTFIQVILNYGFIGLIVFISYLFIPIAKVIKQKNSFYKTLFISTICSILITFVTQDYHRFFEFQIIFNIIYLFEDNADLN